MVINMGNQRHSLGAEIFRSGRVRCTPCRRFTPYFFRSWPTPVTPLHARTPVQKFIRGIWYFWWVLRAGINHTRGPTEAFCRYAELLSRCMRDLSILSPLSERRGWAWATTNPWRDKEAGTSERNRYSGCKSTIPTYPIGFPFFLNTFHVFVSLKNKINRSDKPIIKLDTATNESIVLYVRTTNEFERLVKILMNVYTSRGTLCNNSCRICRTLSMMHEIPINKWYILHNIVENVAARGERTCYTI